MIHEAQIAHRSGMYTDSARQAFERGKTRAHGVPLLPEYPGGGSTICLSNCRCEWGIEEVRGEEGELHGWNCTWVISPPEKSQCVDCQAYAVKWAPLWVPV